jgi:hypothetical protein
MERWSRINPNHKFFATNASAFLYPDKQDRNPDSHPGSSSRSRNPGTRTPDSNPWWRWNPAPVAALCNPRLPRLLRNKQPLEARSGCQEVFDVSPSYIRECFRMLRRLRRHQPFQFARNRPHQFHDLDFRPPVQYIERIEYRSRAAAGGIAFAAVGPGRLWLWGSPALPIAVASRRQRAAFDSEPSERHTGIDEMQL